MKTRKRRIVKAKRGEPSLVHQPEDRDLKIPRLSRGKGYGGPEYFRCSNTGCRPIILHSVSGKFFVGPQLAVEDVKALQYSPLVGKRRKVVLDPVKAPKSIVYIYKTRTPAVAKFLELCKEVWKWNDDQRAQYNEAARLSRSLNPEERARGAHLLMNL